MSVCSINIAALDWQHDDSLEALCARKEGLQSPPQRVLSPSEF